MQPSQCVAGPSLRAVQGQVVYPVPPRGSQHSHAVKSLGILQIAIAGLSAVLGISTLLMGSVLGILASGIWSGLLFYLPAGILGILSVTTSPSARKGLTIACMVMSILSSVVAVVNIGVYTSSAALDHYYYIHVAAPLVLDAILALIALTELVISTVAAAYCCWVINKGHTTDNATYVLRDGILGILSATISPSARKGLVIACMVLSILSSVVAVVNIGVCTAPAALEHYYYNDHYSSYYDPHVAAPLVLDAILALIALTELVISIVAAACYCKFMKEGQTTDNAKIASEVK